MFTKSRWTDQDVEAIIGIVLRTGVMLAAGVVLIGGILYLVRHGGSAADYRVFHGEPSDLRQVAGIVTAAIALQGRGIIQLGLLILIATPVVRVAFSVVGFAAEGDRMYASFTLLVLLILLYSLLGPS